MNTKKGEYGLMQNFEESLELISMVEKIKSTFNSSS